MTTLEEAEVVEAQSSSSMLYPILIVTAILTIIHYWRENSRFVKLGNKLPGPPTLPFIGNIHMIFGITSSNEIMEKALEISKDYPPVVRGWIGTWNLFVFLMDPRDIEIILSSHVHIDKSVEYRMFKPWLGDGLLISTGDKWRAHRKLIAPTFHLNVLKSFVGLFNKNGQTLVQRLKKEVGKPSFDAHDYLSETTVDTLLETAMGVKRTSQDGEGYDYAMAVMKMCDIIHQRTYKVWLRLEPIFRLVGMAKEQLQHLNTIHGLSSKVIKKKKEEFLKRKESPVINNYEAAEYLETEKEAQKGTYFDQSQGLKDDLDDDVGEKKRMAFLDLMIESAQSGAVISDDEIKEEVDTIMFEGHDTTAAASSFTLCLLGIHQAIQEKVMDELYQIFGDSDRPATFADTLEMKYLERVILETIRLYPPVPIIARQLKEDVQLASGDYLLPAGCTVVIGTYKVHRNPEIYPNPEEFNPDNFLPEKMQNRHYYGYIPFSAGPRSCVGRKYAMLKLKILLSTVLRNYKIVSDIKESEFKLQADIILKRTDGFRIKIEPRKSVKAM
ncbi:cytochrome P450 4g15-like [Schistocerca americana]|uniref:cytochrome P450 4g15-like n=1 Tax=Schistocerca americana TaxID=7009 RepID=UPI001F503413|nr:cytochrome P450 4g15-like [Schistocerca americana]XP_046992772.1 cytochrome P450 4g15-like [Schistocerca americana]